MIFLVFCLLLSGFEESGAMLLAIPTGAKAVGMGSAFTAVADDATCMHYNPAGLAFARKASFTSVNAAIPPGIGSFSFEGLRALADIGRKMAPDLRPDWLPGVYPGMRLTYSGAVMPIPGHGSVGISYTYLCTGKTVVRDPNGAPLAEWESYDYAITLSYGRPLLDVLGLGCSARYIRSFLAPDWISKEMGMEGRGSDGTLALDLGVLVKTPMPLPGLSLGGSYNNTGGEIGVGRSDLPLPRMLRLGLAFEPTATLDAALARYGFPGISRYLKYTYARDRVSDLVGSSHHDYRSRGNEITLLNAVSYRWGLSEGINGLYGKTEGYAVRAGFVTFEAARDHEIYPESWRVQIAFSPLEPTQLEEIRSRPELDSPAVLFASLVAPGGGQLYKGETVKALLFLSAGMFFSEWDSRERGAIPKMGLGAVYAASILDAVQTLSKKRGSSF